MRSNLPAQPWEHLLGLLLIEIGADHRVLGPQVAHPKGRGRPRARQAEAQATQALITGFDAFLHGGDPLSLTDWHWLRSLYETGLCCVGLMPPIAARGVGRPAVLMFQARSLMKAKRLNLLLGTHGALVKAIRVSAADTVLRRRQVQAAWANQPFASIAVATDDPDVTAEVNRLYATYRSLKRRAHQ